MKERDIERIFVEEIRKEGGRAYKWTSPGNDGVPDRIIVLPGGVIAFVELKQDRGRVSPIQKVQLHRLADLGCDVEVVKGLDGVAGWLRRHRLPEAADRVTSRAAREEARQAPGKGVM